MATTRVPGSTDPGPTKPSPQYPTGPGSSAEGPTRTAHAGSNAEGPADPTPPHPGSTLPSPVLGDPPAERASDEGATALAATLAAAAAAPGGEDIRHTVRSGSDEGAPSFFDAELPPERYHEAETLGAGGMGEVRVLRDEWIGRDVARKIMRPEVAVSEEALARFLREIRVQGQLEHPSIVPVYDVGRSGPDGIYFTMRRIQGMTLAAVIEGLGRGDEALRARFSRRKLLTAFSSVCMTVHYAHSRGVVHRDLKPSNIMLGDYGEVYVLDWGIAKLVQGGARELSQTGQVMGTIGYMPPEQARGEKNLDARADVYALGVILFEILTGEHVFEGLDANEVMQALRTGLEVRPTSRKGGADVPPELDAACVRAMARLPADRFGSAQSFSDAVERYLDGDRDLTRRRELADGYAAEAEAQAERALSRETPAGEAEPARAAAVRGVFKALALAPEQAGAQRTLARLLFEVPDELPPAVAVERAARRAEERAEGARFASLGFASYVLPFPLILLIGVRSWPVVAGGMILTVLAALFARWAHRTRAMTTLSFMVLLVLNVLVVMFLGSWLGPFVLLPTAATITTSLFALYSERRERTVVLVAGAAMFLIPLAAELFGLVPRGFSFEAGRVVLHPRALDLPPTLTTIALVYTTVTYILLPGVFHFRVRDELRVADDRRFLQAWAMKQLFPRDVPGG